MSLTFYPEDPEDYIKSELRALKFIIDKEELFSQELSDLLVKAKCAYYKIKEKKTEFIFSSKTDLLYKKKDYEILFGANIVSKDNKYSELTYYIAICDKTSKTIILKFHFDYSGCDCTQKQKHPISHMQIGGRLSGELKKLQYKYKLHESLDEPRFFHQPMTFALLLNLILNEFPNESYQKIVNRSEWREIIHRDEKNILADFYKQCHLFISNAHGDKLFSSDFCYGE